jgi:CheY-like chemotaxis protein
VAIVTSEGALILVAEDDPNDALLLARAFKKANVASAVRRVSDGDQAVAYLAGEREYGDRERHPIPAIVVLDLKLPRRSGLEVLTWIRQHPGLRRLPVVILTSSKARADVDRAYDLGANSYLLKPVDFDALLELVKSLNLYWTVFNQRPAVAGP